ncbi:MAG: dolichol kinase [Ignavibacteriales bacterium]|nr:dolichol kinase [Ignavibacteriales bacterium]
MLDQKATIKYRAEIIRKGIHLCSLSIPVVYYYISRETALYILVPITAAFFLTDIARYTIPAVGVWYYRTFGMLLRQHEQDHKARRLTGATNILLSAVVCVALLPKIITVNAFAILIISDTTSALVGRRFGKRPFLSKSLEGTLAFFGSAILVVLIAPKITGSLTEYVLWIAGAATGALAEASVSQVDDNISVPLTIGLILWGLYWLFLPGIDLYV